MALTIRVEHINPFIVSNMETFSKMVGVEAKPGKLMLKKDAKLDYDVSGIIGLSGKVIGTVAISFPEATAITVCNKFMSADYANLHDDILDAVGELVNIVAGNAKKGLSDFNIEISLPTVVMGRNHRIIEPNGALSFVMPFTTSLGAFHMAVSLKIA
ncbi:MAG: chemotaxis protein CheX [Fibrobacterota bacterium]|nr:chemotaxis protein CheX [Fibrobacterota bacterium]